VVLASAGEAQFEVGDDVVDALETHAEADEARAHTRADLLGLAELTVRDNGVGMTEAESARAFDRFWRAQKSRTTPGFGLGLPLVRQIVMAHHGQVSVESAVGVGTTVTLVFPVTQQ
jgi:signal transduction histidine kinase